MKKSIVLTSAIAFSVSASMAMAGGIIFGIGKSDSRYLGDVPLEANAIEIPPLGYKSQNWKSASGCEYTRAGRPGETVWYLIMNSLKGQSCDRIIVEHVLDDNVQMSKLAMR
jgi:hypothetical protein